MEHRPNDNGLNGSETSNSFGEKENTTLPSSQKEDAMNREYIENGVSHSANVGVEIISVESDKESVKLKDMDREEIKNNADDSKIVDVTVGSQEEDTMDKKEMENIIDVNSSSVEIDEASVKLPSFFFAQDKDDNDEELQCVEEQDYSSKKVNGFIVNKDLSEAIEIDDDVEGEVQILNSSAHDSNSQKKDCWHVVKDCDTEIVIDVDRQQLECIPNPPVTSVPSDSQAYRNMNPLVFYSDSEKGSDIESSETSSDDESDTDNEGDSGHDSDIGFDQVKKKEGQRATLVEGEIFPEDLPPLDYLTISVSEDVVLEPIGTVSGIVDVLVIIQAAENSPALYDDTVLFLENRQPFGLIFETLGTVERPYYSIRFNSNQDIVSRNVNVGDNVFFAPKANNFTKYVFIAELRRLKFDDASWENDNEPPPEEKFYSDDEQEREARKLAKEKVGDPEGTKKKKRKRRSLKPKNDTGTEQMEPNRSRLLPGSMNRNPFGFQPPNCNDQFAMNPPPFFRPNFTGQRFVANPWRPPHPGPRFGGKPAWQEQPGLIGPRPNDQAFSLNPPMFRPFANQPQPHPGSMSARGPPCGGLGFNRPPPPTNTGIPFPPPQNPFWPTCNNNSFGPPPGAPHMFQAHLPRNQGPNRPFSSS